MLNWLENLNIQMHTRRAIVVYGNVGDSFYEETYPSSVNITTFLAQRIQKMPERYEVVVWNPITGIQPFSSTARRGLQKEVHSLNLPEANTRPANASRYDLGEQGTFHTSLDEVLKTSEQFFAFLGKRFSNSSRDSKHYVFILDAMDSQFGNAHTLSEKDRNQLLMLSKTIRDSDCSLDAASLQNPGDLLILITNKLESIPAPLYSDSPAVTSILVPLPNRKERKTLLAKCCTSFQTQETILPGTPIFEELVDAMDGYTFRDIAQIIRLSCIGEEPFSIRRLLNYYRYGSQSSPWEDLHRERVARLEEELKSRVKGQDAVLSHVAKTIRKAYMGFSGLQHSRRQQMPKGIFFFVGPTGVGKTETAKALAQFLFGDEESCIRFDMSEYNHEHSDQRLVGSPPGYVGYEEGGQLTRAIRERPFSVLLFDEIEKAHPKILDKFLQILEDGRLTDGRGETVSFSESVIIFTSNIGAAEVSPEEPDTDRWFHQHVVDRFKNEMRRPELLNRIGIQNVLPFRFLKDTQVMLSIMKSKLRFLREKLREKFQIRELVFDDEEKVLSSMLQGYDYTNGGRGVANCLDQHLLDPLAEALFHRNVSDLAGKTLVVSRPNETLQFSLE